MVLRFCVVAALFSFFFFLVVPCSSHRSNNDNPGGPSWMSRTTSSCAFGPCFSAGDGRRPRRGFLGGEGRPLPSAVNILTGGVSSRRRQVVLFYKNDTADENNNKREDEGEDHKKHLESSSSSRQSSPMLVGGVDALCPPDDDDASSSSSSSSITMIPVIGPIPGELTLLMGGELFLDAPTPLQWYALEEAVRIHQQQSSSNNNNNNVTNVVDARIAAAPIIAILDDATASQNHHHPASSTNAPPPPQWSKFPNGQSNGKRYATLAAFMGMSQKNNNNNADQNGGDDEDRKTIRLLAIGRAALSQFKYRRPSSDHDLDDDDDDDDEEHAEEQDVDDSSSSSFVMRTNIVMAQMEWLHDDNQNTRHSQTNMRCSPAHALAQLSKLAQQLQFLQMDRQSLVAKLQTAQARLQYVYQDEGRTTSRDQNAARMLGLENDMDDHDGLGALFAQKQQQQQQEQLQDQEQTLTTAEETTTTKDSPQSTTVSSSSHQSTENSFTSPPFPTTMHNNHPMEDTNVGYDTIRANNYGLGSTALTVCTIPALTRVWMEERLSPYYSSEWRQRYHEEFYYELYSFVVVLALQSILTPAQLAWTMTTTNTLERLEYCRTIMQRHVDQLKQQATVVEQELRDCGDECTDLW